MQLHKCYKISNTSTSIIINDFKIWHTLYIYNVLTITTINRYINYHMTQYYKIEINSNVLTFVFELFQ